MLNKNSFGRIALAMSVLAFAGAAMAAEDTGQVHVTAALTSACEVTGSPTINFGSFVALESSGNQLGDTGTNFQVACSSDVTPKIYSGTERILVNGENDLPFNLSLTSGAASDDLGTDTASANSLTLVQDGSPHPVTLYAKVLPANFKALPQGTYQTDITVAVTY